MTVAGYIDVLKSARENFANAVWMATCTSEPSTAITADMHYHAVACRSDNWQASIRHISDINSAGA